MYPDIGKLFEAMLFLLIVFIPLGVWKIIDIIIWLFNHVSISFS
jgi:hypothetical protein